MLTFLVRTTAPQRRSLGGHPKTGQSSTLQNRPVESGVETSGV